MKRGADLSIGNLSSYRVGIDTYDQDKLGLGNLMIQKSGAGAEDNYAGPAPITILRPMETSLPFAVGMPWVMRWSENATSEIDWEFNAELSTAAATRRIMMSTYNRKTGVRNFVGGIILTFPGTSEAKTFRGFRMKYKKITAGTVTVAGTAVTGASTDFLNLASVGSRIGFGSTDPTQIVSWYSISAIASATGLTLATTAGTIGAGTPYVIEELQAVMAMTSLTTTNGGLYVAKGLCPEIFQPVTATTVPAATTVDRIRAVYHVADASTVTNTVALGMGIDTEADNSTHYVYVIDGLTNPILFKYNINVTLTLTAGKATNGFVLKSGASASALSGSPTQVNNGRLVNAAHGPGAGIECFYFTTASRVYRSIDVNTITSGLTTWIADNMIEQPVGGSTTFAVTSTLQSIEYASAIDMFMIPTSLRVYFTKYKTDSSQFDRTLLLDTKQIDQAAADATTTPHPTMNATAYSTWIEGGLAYLVRLGTTSIANMSYTFPIGADWEYATLTSNRLITPRIATPDAKRYYRMFAADVQVVGGDTGKNLGMNTEPYRLYYRTSGISDNTGGWSLIPDNGDISAVAGATHIQFMAEFRCQWTGVCARLQSFGVIYEDISNDSHFLPSATLSDAVNKRFAWYFATAFGGTVPNLQVTLYDADTGGTLLTDNFTASAFGTFEKSTNTGGAWSGYTNADRANATTYIRYTPSSLADSIKVRAVLSLA